PAADTWAATRADATTPAWRAGHTALWTGTEMIVWGGDDASASGGRYDPTNDSWRPTRLDGTTPAGRRGHTSVWTGQDMLVWGGVISRGNYVVDNSGGRYDPRTDQWRPTSVAAGTPAARAAHSAVWSGSEMTVSGGQDA